MNNYFLIALFSLGLLIPPSFAKVAHAQPQQQQMHTASFDAATKSANELYAESYALEAKGLFADAIKPAEIILAAGETFDIRLRLGWLNYNALKHEKSLENYLRALELSPTSVDARLGIMLPLMALERWQDALVYGENLLADDGNNMWANRYTALVYYMLERYQDAEALYEKSLEITPDNALMMLGLGLSLVSQNKLDEGKGYCREAGSQMPGDERVRTCLEHKGKPWTYSTQIYTLSGFYTDPWDKDNFAGGLFVQEFNTPVDVGFQLDFSYSWNRMKYEKDDYHQFQPGAAVYYLADYGTYWLHYSLLFSKDDSEQINHIISVYGNYKWEIGLGAGSSLDVGIYDGFQTLQLTPELTFDPASFVSIKLAPMLQMRLGKLRRGIPASGRQLQRKFRGSGELSLSFFVPYTDLTVSGFYGQRWYTVENKGLMLWNSDEEIVGGLRFDAKFKASENISPQIGFRYDYADHQFGEEHEFHILGFMLGLNFSY